MTEAATERRPNIFQRAVDSVRNYPRNQRLRFHEELRDAMDSLAGEGKGEFTIYEIAERDAYRRFPDHLMPPLLMRKPGTIQRGLDGLVESGDVVRVKHGETVLYRRIDPEEDFVDNAGDEVFRSLQASPGFDEGMRRSLDQLRRDTGFGLEQSVIRQRHSRLPRTDTDDSDEGREAAELNSQRRWGHALGETGWERSGLKDKAAQAIADHDAGKTTPWFTEDSEYQ